MTIKGLINHHKLRNYRRIIPTIVIIFCAALMIVLISLSQYKYARQLVEEELSHRAENEMTIKAIFVKSLLSSHEKMVRNYLWPIQHQIHNPEALYGILNRIVTTNNDVTSSFVAFVPGYYPDREFLFEPSASRLEDSIITLQVASDKHDYTQREFYHNAIENDSSCWCDPYTDKDASGENVTTYAVPYTDDAGKTAAAFGIDLSTKSIIDTLNTRHNFPSTFFLLLTEDGQLISQPDSSHTQQSDVAAVVKMINDSTYERKSSSSGRSKIISFNDKEKGKGYIYHAFMKGQPHWQVVMVCYDKEVFSKLNRMSRNFLLLMLGAFSLLGFIIYRFNQYVTRLHESRLNKERTDSELHVAQTIQSEMLPHSDISRPDVDMSGKQVSALEVGGDLYDYFIRDEKLYFCIGDVSGKGVPSSLVMAVVHSLFRSLSQNETNPSYIMKAINESACEGNQTNMFVTLFVGVLDLPTGRLRYCNAGHDAPLLVGRDVGALSCEPNLPIGVVAGYEYTQQEVSIDPKTTIFLFTDGLNEAENYEHAQFGDLRIWNMAKLLLDEQRHQPKHMIDAMANAVHTFVGDAEQSDDLTMLAIQYMPFGDVS